MTRVSILPFALLPLLALAACGPKADQSKATDEPAAPSSEWAKENPTEPAIPVDLPTTPMTNAPTAAVSPAASPSGN